MPEFSERDSFKESRGKPFIIMLLRLVCFCLTLSLSTLNLSAEIHYWGKFAGADEPELKEELSGFNKFFIGDISSYGITSDGHLYVNEPVGLDSGKWRELSNDVDYSELIHEVTGVGPNYAISQDGQLFDIQTRSSPVLISYESKVISVASMGLATAILFDDGEIVVRSGPKLRSRPPIAFDKPELDFGKVIKLVATERTFVALNIDGEVFTWGEGLDGELRIPDTVKDIVDISAGSEHIMALRNDGRVICWGSNFWGQCAVPRGLYQVDKIQAGKLHSLAYTNDGRLVHWGKSIDGFQSGWSSGEEVVMISSSWGGLLVITNPKDQIPGIRSITLPLNRSVGVNELVKLELNIPPEFENENLQFQWKLNGQILHNQSDPVISIQASGATTDMVEVLGFHNEWVSLGLIYFYLDSDSDGLDDLIEQQLGLDPFESDSDVDGLSDRDEVINGLFQDESVQSQTIHVNNSRFHLRFMSQVGVRYHLVDSWDLEVWKSTTEMIMGDGNLIEYVDKPRDIVFDKYYRFERSQTKAVPPLMIYKSISEMEYYTIPGWVYQFEVMSLNQEWKLFDHPFTGNGKSESYILPDDHIFSKVRLKLIQK